MKEGLKYFDFGLPEGPLVLTPSAAVTGIVIGVVVTIFSSLLPARKASQVSPLEAIRDSQSTPKRKSLLIRLLVGSLVSLTGLGVLFGVLYSFLRLPTLSVLQQVGLGASVIFIGISVITPSITKPFVTIFDSIYKSIFGILGKLATENSKRTPRRTASTASALMIGLTLISLANVLTTSFKAQAEKVVKEVVLADYQVSAAQIFASPGIPTGLSEELIALDEVTELSRTRATVVGYNNRPLILGAVDKEVFDLIKTVDIAGSREDFYQQDAIGVLNFKAENDDISLNDKVTLTIPEVGKKEFVVRYIFDWTTQPPAEFFLLLENHEFFSNESLDTELYFNVINKDENEVTFMSASGELSVKRNDDLYELNFPKDNLIKIDLKDQVEDSIGVKPIETYIGDINLFAILDSEDAIRALTPDFDKLIKLEGQGLIVSAQSNECDFVSRYFCPKYGINEDPVTGSAHTSLIPYWSERLNSLELVAKQVSKRGGVLYCKNKDNRVLISGKAVLYMKGEIKLS